CNHSEVRYQLIGAAIKKAMPTSFKKSLDNKNVIVEVLAPTTLRIPISFFLWFTTNNEIAKRPMQLSTMASIDPLLIIVVIFRSSLKVRSMFSSKKEPINSVSGSKVFQTSLTLSYDCERLSGATF